MKRCPCCWRGNCTKTPPPVRHRAGRGKWKRFFLENQNEYDAAANMLALQLESGDVTDPQEFIFLLNRLEDMLNDMVKRGEIKDEAGLRNLWERLGELQGQYLQQFDLDDK